MSYDESTDYVAYIGIDWASKKHDICTYDENGKIVKQEIIINEPENLYRWIAEVRNKFPTGQVAICLEQARGSLISFLTQFDWIELYPINPATMSRFRRAFYPSYSKSDMNDAKLIGSILLTHREHLRKWQPDDTQTRKLDRLNRFRRKVVDRRTGLKNHLRHTLNEYFPQALELSKHDIGCNLSCLFLLKWSTPKAAMSATEEELRQFYRQSNCRKATLIEDRIATIKSITELTKDNGIIAPCSFEVEILCSQILNLNQNILDIEKEIAIEFTQHTEYELFDSFPGAGAAIAPRLLTALGTDRERFQSADEVERCSGIAPVKEASGKQSWTHMRRQCSKYTRQTFQEYAARSIIHSTWAKAYYRMQREKGSKHQAAVRALAFKWIRIIYRCWKSNTAYDEAKYITALIRSGSPIVSQIKKIEMLA
jgi:transposase